MADIKMTDARIMDLIAAYGAAPMAWPEDEREAAEAMIAAQPEKFEAVLSEARAIDAALGGADMPDASAALAARILADAPTGLTQRAGGGMFAGLKAALFPNGRRWPASAAMASLAMGLVSGYAYAATDVTYDSAETAYSAAFGIDEAAEWLVDEG